MAPPSALIGEPPLTDDDTTIVRGLQMWALSVMKLEGKLHGPTPLLHPEKGFKTPPFRPPPEEYHFETRRPRFLAGACVAIIIMVLITGTRLAIRARSPKLHFGKDDWLIIYGVTTPLYVMVFFLAVAGIKLSIVFFYMRLSGVTSKKWMICHWTLAVILILYSIVTVLISLFSCTPLFVNWDIERMSRVKEPPVCLDTSKIIAGLSVIHVLTDLSLLAVPIFLLWKTQVKQTVKLRIWLVGIVGATSCATSAVRLVEQFRHEYSDGTWNSLGTASWALVELATGAAAASLPVVSFFATRMGKLYHKHRSPTSDRDKDAAEKVLRPIRRHPTTVHVQDSDYLDTISMDSKEPQSTTVHETEVDSDSNGKANSTPASSHYTYGQEEISYAKGSPSAFGYAV
ncbi:MAG: hypothetical protein Q9167_000150 [Letrouitia subvulpina]